MAVLAGHMVPIHLAWIMKALFPIGSFLIYLHGQRSTVYTTDLPMYTKPASSRGASSHPSNVYDTPDDYRGSNGYDNQAFQGPSNYRGGHQQFDRVSAPRKY
uniref:Uncharacterized protein n=1 Tax=Biomphalaria glabrata TaxID=6526 RepID=A0A2C9KQ68_BIOGL